MTLDAASRFYRASHERNLARYTAQTGRVVADLAPEPVSNPSHRYFGAWREAKRLSPSRALELGYGGISTVRAMAEAIPGEYHVTDILDRFSGVSIPANVRPTICNLDHDFPFEDADFELVIALMVVEHLYDPFHAVSEIARVLKPGGRLVMNLPNIASLRCRLQLLRGQMPVTSSRDWFDKREWDGGHLHAFTIETVTRLCEAYGLRLVDLLPVGSNLALKRLRPSLFCHEITFVLQKD